MHGVLVPGPESLCRYLVWGCGREAPLTLRLSQKTNVASIASRRAELAGLVDLGKPPMASGIGRCSPAACMAAYCGCYRDVRRGGAGWIRLCWRQGRR